MGSGVRNLYEFSKIYSGTEPKIEEGDVFKTTVKLYDKDANSSQNHTENHTESSQNHTENHTENHKENTVGLSRIQREIIKKLQENPKYSRQQLANTIENSSLGGVISALSRLQELGIIRREGPDKGGHWVVFQNKPSDFTNIDTTE